MKNIRERFNDNAEEFDELVVEMLEENNKLKLDASRYRWLRERIGDLSIIRANYDYHFCEGVYCNSRLQSINAGSFDLALDEIIKKEN